MAAQELNIERTLQDAIAHHGAGDNTAARGLAEQVLAAQSDNATALQILGIIAAEAGQHQAAYDALGRALAAAPTSAMVMFNLGEVCRAMDRLAEASTYYADAARREPAFTAAHLAAGHATLNLGGAPMEAVTHFRRALDQAPGDADAVSGLARAFEVAGGEAMAARRPAAAAEIFRDWLALEPDHPVALIDLGHALRDQGQLDPAIEHYRRALARRRGSGAMINEALPTFHQTAAFKLRHDAEQFDHLAAAGRLPANLAGMAEAYRDIADVLPPSDDRQRVFALTDAQRRRIGDAYNRFLVEGPGERLAGPAINPDLDRATIEAAYAAPEDGGAEVTAIDDLLTPDALAALRRYCMETTFWFDFFHAGGYLGAYLDDGFDCPLLRQIVEELPERLPGIFADHRLRQMWAYKYASDLTGIPMHADEARVNLNFWLTPDDANLDSGTGGLIVYPKEAPLEWNFETFNNDQDAIRAFIADARPLAVPHRQNRAVVFNSDYFHRTGDLHFKPGYENRRINVTMLFGWRDGREPGG